MFDFLRKLWGLTRPYRGRLLLAILTGILGGLIEPLMVATIVFVYSLIFPAANPALAVPQLKWAPEFLRHWAVSVQQSLSSGTRMPPAAVVGLVALIPSVIVLRGLFSYLNVYLLQWVSIRSITDLRSRLFQHIMSLSAGFFSRTSTGELMARVMSDTSTLQGIISGATTVAVKDPVTLLSLLTYVVVRSVGWAGSRP